MATEPTAAPVTFSSPSMRARAHLVRGLQLTDELERAWTRRDYWTARGLARQAQETIHLARLAYDEAWATTGDLEAIEPAPAAVVAQAPRAAAFGHPEDEAITEDEAREVWGDVPPIPSPSDVAADGMEQYQADGR